MLTPPLARLLAQALEQQKAGRLDAAAQGYARVLAAQPRNFEVLQRAGDLALLRKRPAEALPLLAAAIRLQPASLPCLIRLGLAYHGLGRQAEAERALRQALAVQADHVETLVTLNHVLTAAGRLDEAVALLERVTVLKPADASVWVSLGALYVQLNRETEAITCHTRALALEPTHRTAHYFRAQALQRLHRLDEALADYDRQIELQPGHAAAHSFRLFLLNYRDELSREQLYAEHQRFARALPSRPDAPRNWPQTRDPGRRVRIGFLSPDFRAHACAAFIEPILRHLDPASFEIVLYHDHFQVDDVSLRLRGLAAQWRHVMGRSDDDLEAFIREDRVDVLIDLAGHSGFNRLPLYTRRLAPVQATYLGYPNTTGLAAMDYRFTDALADPVGETEALHSEKLVRFSACAWTYQPLAGAPDPAPAPASRGTAFTFGSFNNLSKLSDSTLRLWRELLASVPGSRLLLKGLQLDETALHRRLEQLGFDRTRVVLAPPRPTVLEHLAGYHEVDVALDPFPYAGTTTTCEALWMGVPVITLAGDRHAARVGVSLLTAVGHPEWIATTPAGFIELGQRLAAAPRSPAPRSALRAEMTASLLHDHAGQAARFGQAVRALWQTWCRANPA